MKVEKNISLHDEEKLDLKKKKNNANILQS